MTKEKLLGLLSWVIIIIGALGTIISTLSSDKKNLLFYAMALAIGVIGKITEKKI